jgi:hypothetical protein
VPTVSDRPISYVFYLDHDDPGTYWGFEDPGGWGESVDFQVMAHSLEDAARELAKSRFGAAEAFEADPSLVDEAVAAFTRHWRIKWLPPFSDEAAYRTWSKITWLPARRAGR